MTPVEKAVEDLRRAGLVADKARHARATPPSVRIVGGTSRGSTGFKHPFRIEETRSGWIVATLDRKWNANTLDAAVTIIINHCANLRSNP